MTRPRTRLAIVCAMAVTAVLAIVPVASAAGPGGPGGGSGGGGGGGGGHETTATNNLSVPTIMISGGFTGVTCGTAVESPSALVFPTGTPLSGYSIDPAAYYYVQGIHKWQAQCYTATAATGTAAWGDNLSGDAKLQVGKPIRVELGLFDSMGVQMDGFTVVKLEPDKLDRESAYGTLATIDDDGLTYHATATTISPVRVFDGAVTFSIKNVATGAYVVQPGSNPTAEINAGGAVVYGYNLRVATAGEYEITFTIPSVTITGVDAGTFTPDPLGPDTVTLVINVIAGGGGGGGPRR